MASLLQDLMGSVLSGEGVDVLAQKSGADTSTIKNIASSGLPVLLQSMLSNAKDSSQAESLGKALSDHASKEASPLKQIEEADTTDGQKIISHLLGDKTSTVQEELAKDSGASTDVVSSVLSSLAPMLMNQVGKNMGVSAGSGSGDLASSLMGLLGGSGSSDLSGILKSVMKDGDGDGTPDVLEGLLGLFKK